MAQGKFESGKQVFVLVGLLAIILIASYIAFVHFLIVPPITAALVSFATPAPLALLHRSLRASAALDERIAELNSADELLPLSAPELVSLTIWPQISGAHRTFDRSNGSGYLCQAPGNKAHVINWQASYGHLLSLPEDDLHDAVVVPNFPDSKDKPTDYETQATSARAAAQLRLPLGIAEERTGALIIAPFP